MQAFKYLFMLALPEQRTKGRQNFDVKGFHKV